MLKTNVVLLISILLLGLQSCSKSQKGHNIPAEKEEYGKYVVEQLRKGNITSYADLFAIERDYLETIPDSLDTKVKAKMEAGATSKVAKIQKEIQRSFDKLNSKVKKLELDWQKAEYLNTDHKERERAGTINANFTIYFKIGEDFYTLQSKNVMKVERGWVLTQGISIAKK